MDHGTLIILAYIPTSAITIVISDANFKCSIFFVFIKIDENICFRCIKHWLANHIFSHDFNIKCNNIKLIIITVIMEQPNLKYIYFILQYTFFLDNSVKILSNYS